MKGSLVARSTILLIEGDPRLRKLVRALLGRAGYQVLQATDGRSALEIVHEETIDLVVQDLRLPDMHGIDLAAVIRETRSIEDLPILAVSSVSSTLESANNIELLFSESLLKPVEPSQLLEVVRAYLPVDGETSELPGQRRLILVADDDALQRRVTASRLRRKGFRVREAADGAQALEQALIEPPAAIVSDVLMPRIDGIRLCQTVRAHPVLAETPFVLVSSGAIEEEDSRMAVSAGANGIVRRSTSCKELLSTVFTLLEERPEAPTVSDLSITSELGETDSGPQQSVDSTDYRARMIRQLERQAQITSELSRISNLRAAQLSVLAGVSETLTRTLDLQAALEEALARCMDVSVFSLGAVYLVEGNDLLLTASHGFPDAVQPQLQDLFGFHELLHRVLDEQESSPSRARYRPSSGLTASWSSPARGRSSWCRCSRATTASGRSCWRRCSRTSASGGSRSRGRSRGSCPRRFSWVARWTGCRCRSSASGGSPRRSPKRC